MASVLGRAAAAWRKAGADDFVEEAFLKVAKTALMRQRGANLLRCRK
eukprot:gene7090-17256_t